MKALLAAGLLCFGLTSLAVLPFFIIGEVRNSGCCGGATPVTHDGAMHYNQMVAFWRGLASGQIYPRWDEATHHGYGAPTMIFYPPAVYYLTSFYYLILGDWHYVIIVLHWVMMATSGVAIYLLARQTMSTSAAIMPMAVYLIAPYHLINQYQRGAIAEQLSFIWMPLILLFANRLWNVGISQISNFKFQIPFAGLAASYGAFLWSHPPTAYQFTLVFGFCFAVWVGWNIVFRNTRRRVKKWLEILLIAGALVFGSMLAAAYLFPAIAEQHLINADDVELTWPYHSSYVFDDTQTVYDHINDHFIIRIDRIWVFNVAAVALTGFVLFVFRKNFRSGDHRAQAGLWFATSILAAFLMMKYSYPIGRFIPKIEMGVFSWRMLALTSLGISLLAGACMQLAVQSIEQRNPLMLIGGSAASLLILVGSAAMSVWYVIIPMYRAEAFKPIPEHYNYATLPRGTPRQVPEMEMAQLASGAGRIIPDLWQPEYRRLYVELDKTDQLQIRTSNFPGWTALVDGQIAEIKDGKVGNIVVDLPAGKHRVTLEFRSTSIRRVGNWITVLSFFLLISMIVLAKRPKPIGGNNESNSTAL